MTFCRVDHYIKSLFESSHSVVYLDSAMLSENYRKRTSFYNKYLKPQGFPYAAGIIFIAENTFLGALSIFRSEIWGDFSNREIYMLDILKEHLTNILSKLYIPNKEQERKKREQNIIGQFNFTTREQELLPLLISGYSNEEISKLLHISNFTTKKHIYNIFNKIGINNRMELIRIINSK